MKSAQSRSRLERERTQARRALAAKYPDARLPGLGEVKWDQFISALYAVGNDYVLSIEHKERAFERIEELVKRGS